MTNALPGWLCATEHPHPSLGDAARLFEPVLGHWDMTCAFTSADGAVSQAAGEWHFGWILGGRMIQDAIYFYPDGPAPADPLQWKGGTTLRLFDPRTGDWQVSFFAASRAEVIHLRGGAQGPRIVLHGVDVDGSALRWSFNDIGPSSFRWLGETSADGGRHWRVEQEMHLRRRPAPRS